MGTANSTNRRRWYLKNKDAPGLWLNTPRVSRLTFLLAVFFIFSSFAFTNDGMNMGRQPQVRFFISVVLLGVFPACYAAAGVILRAEFWKAFIPLFALQFFSMSWLGNRFPDLPALVQFNAIETARLHDRLGFDGIAVIVSVCLGYTGFVYVFVSEGKRYLQTKTEKASLDGEMAAAREVQRIMVPEDLPPIPGYILECVYRPAAEVGGDFFQVIPLKSGSTLVVIGDVSGKGLRAAMVVSMIVGMLRTVSDFSEEPSDILTEINRRLCGRTHGGFATCLAVRLEEGGQMTLANAGHLPPYLNGVETQFAGSMPLGIVETASYEKSTSAMLPGEKTLLLTDGIAEAQNEQGQLLGFSRIESLLSEGATARSIADIAQHHGQTDDITVISIAREA